DLIQRFGSVENAIEHAEEVKQKKYRESLQNNRDLILLSKKLATIHCDVPVEFELDSAAVREPGVPRLREIYTRLEFSSRLREIGPAAEPAGPVDYQTLEDEAALAGWLGTLGVDASVAVAAGEMMGETVVAFSAKPSESRSVSATTIPSRASVAHDIKALVR